MKDFSKGVSYYTHSTNESRMDEKPKDEEGYMIIR